MDLSERFIYRPHQNKGIHCYDGTPCATREVYESIGEIGITEIHRVMQKMIAIRKKMFGSGKPEYYGFNDREIFFDLETATGIELHSDVQQAREGRISNEFPFPELLENENAYLMKQTFPLGKNLGKRAFKNRVEDWQRGDFLIQSIRCKQNDAIRAIKWLKQSNFKLLMQTINE